MKRESLCLMSDVGYRARTGVPPPLTFIRSTPQQSPGLLPGHPGDTGPSPQAHATSARPWPHRFRSTTASYCRAAHAKGGPDGTTNPVTTGRYRCFRGDRQRQNRNDREPNGCPPPAITALLTILRGEPGDLLANPHRQPVDLPAMVDVEWLFGWAIVGDRRPQPAETGCATIHAGRVGRPSLSVKGIADLHICACYHVFVSA
jgi:hypothetical protein